MREMILKRILEILKDDDLHSMRWEPICRWLFEKYANPLKQAYTKDMRRNYKALNSIDFYDLSLLEDVEVLTLFENVVRLNSRQM